MMGRRFFESHVPDAVEALKNIAKELRDANELKRQDLRTDVEKVPKQASTEIDRKSFMAFFRRDDFHEQITVDDAHEIFLQILHGSSDLSAGLLKNLFGEYGMDFDYYLKVTSGHKDDESFDFPPS
jgi:hypothetical protein